MGLEEAKDALKECQKEYSSLCGEFGHLHAQLLTKKQEFDELEKKSKNIESQLKSVIQKASSLQANMPKEAPPAETITEKKDEASNG